ncbi:MAG: hypothetical protein HYU52_14245 [Acidobacteria bacterium]|nr:hypothetical protein [Acidobacteriota bacterium]
MKVQIVVLMSLALLFLAACCGKQSVASRSAAALRDAEAKGTPVEAAPHGSHDPATAETPATIDIEAMDEKETHDLSTPDHMAGMKHGHADAANVRPKHGQHGQTPPPKGRSAIEHDAMQHGAAQHSTAHGGATPPSGTPSISVDEQAADADTGKAAAALQPDPLDTPSGTSITDAARSAEMAQMMSSGGHSMVHGEYVHKDVGRTVAPMQHDTSAHEEKPVYTCPMHPNVRSGSPGACPKCGMTLIKKKETH